MVENQKGERFHREIDWRNTQRKGGAIQAQGYTKIGALITIEQISRNKGEIWEAQQRYIVAEEVTTNLLKRKTRLGERSNRAHQTEGRIL